jgi:hypothetical protein
MKIRMKRDHQTTRDVIECGHARKPWLSQNPVNGTTTMYSEDVWEVVPDETWIPMSVRGFGCGDSAISVHRRNGDMLVSITLPPSLRAVLIGDGAVRFEERVW